MNIFVILLIGFLGKFLTLTFTHNMQQLIQGKDVNSHLTYSKTSRQDPPSADLWFMSYDEFRTLLSSYSNLVLMDLYFEIFKNIVVGLTRYFVPTSLSIFDKRLLAEPKSSSTEDVQRKRIK